MYELDIRGIPVSFPFEAYDNQKLYMQRVMDALQKVRLAIAHPMLLATCPTVATWVAEAFVDHSFSISYEQTG